MQQISCKTCTQTIPQADMPSSIYCSNETETIHLCKFCMAHCNILTSEGVSLSTVVTLLSDLNVRLIGLQASIATVTYGLHQRITALENK